MELIHFTNGTSCPDIAKGVAEALSKQPKSPDRPPDMDVVPGLMKYRAEKLQAIKEHEELAATLKQDLARVEWEIARLVKASKTLSALQPSSQQIAALQNNERLHARYTSAKDALTARLNRATTLAEQTERILKETLPKDFDDLVRQYKALL